MSQAPTVPPNRAVAAPAQDALAPRSASASQPAKPAPKAVEQEPVRPPARPARTRGRHRFLAASFVFIILVPIAAAASYLWLAAADQYASNLAFSVRSEDQSSAIELLGGITELSGSSSSDTDILFSFLTSQQLVAKVDERVDLVGIWSKVPITQDPLFSYDPAGTIEDLVAHWERKIAIVYDSGTQLIDLRVLAFDPQDAQDIAQVVLEESTEMINELSAIAREDSIKYAREELEIAFERLRNARTSLTRFRNRTQIVDPSIDTQNQMGVLVTLQQQLADALIEFDLLQETTANNDPRIEQANRRVEVIQKRIDAERRKLGLGTSDEAGVVFADLVGEYEGLIVDREFAEVAYTTALAAHDSAVSTANRQSRYLAAHVQPTLAQKAEFPERLKIVALVGLFSFLSWAIVCLVYYSLRDRN